MKQPSELDRRDLLIALAFSIAGLVLHVPFRSQFAYHWDGAQFALAIEKYDMRISQPHPPGYFLYVMLGRLVNLFVGEPHTSLVWLSVVAGAALVAVGYLLATTMFGRGVGVATAVILATSPLCWFYSEIALTSIVDATLVTATVFVCWRAITNGGRWHEVLWMSVLFAAVAGVRQQSGAILVPVWCYTLLNFGHPRWKKLAAALLLTGFFCSLWFAPMVLKTGGLADYMLLLHAKERFDAPKTIWGGGGLRALIINIDVIGSACWVGLLLAAVISVAEFFYWVFGERDDVKQQFYSTHAKQLRVLALWIGPMLLFWLGMYITTPGYVLCFFPGLAIGAGIAVQRFATDVSQFIGRCKQRTEKWSKLVASLLVCGLLVGVNVVFFIDAPKKLDRALVGLPLTRIEIQQHDQQLANCFCLIRERFRSEDVVIYHSDPYFYWGFRQFQYHLPEYRNVLLAPDVSLSSELQNKRWAGQWRQTTFIDTTDDLAGKISLLVVPANESVRSVRGFARYFDLSRARLLDAPGMKLYVIEKHD